MDDPVPMHASTSAHFLSANSAGARARALLQHAMDVVHCNAEQSGQAPKGELLLDDGMMRFARNRFTFTSPGGVYFRYELGQQVSMQAPGGRQDEAELFLWGTVFGAVAWLNDLLPLHASAVETGGRILAFTADSGAGKSTLAAALAERGFRHVCDDTLVLAPSNAGFVGLPDGKPLKLWDDALSVVSALKQSEIAAVPGKNYAEVANVCLNPAPLTDLIFVKDGDQVSLNPIVGSEKLQCFPEAMYRGFLHTARDDADYHAQLMVMAATTVRFWRLTRPRDFDAFQPTMEAIAGLLRTEVQG